MSCTSKSATHLGAEILTDGRKESAKHIFSETFRTMNLNPKTKNNTDVANTQTTLESQLMGQKNEAGTCIKSEGESKVPCCRENQCRKNLASPTCRLVLNHLSNLPATVETLYVDGIRREGYIPALLQTTGGGGLNEHFRGPEHHLMFRISKNKGSL